MVLDAEPADEWGGWFAGCKKSAEEGDRSFSQYVNLGLKEYLKRRMKSEEERLFKGYSRRVWGMSFFYFVECSFLFCGMFFFILWGVSVVYGISFGKLGG